MTIYSVFEFDIGAVGAFVGYYSEPAYVIQGIKLNFKTSKLEYQGESLTIGTLTNYLKEAGDKEPLIIQLPELVTDCIVFQGIVDQHVLTY